VQGCSLPVCLTGSVLGRLGSEGGSRRGGCESLLLLQQRLPGFCQNSVLKLEHIRRRTANIVPGDIVVQLALSRISSGSMLKWSSTKTRKLAQWLNDLIMAALSKLTSSRDPRVKRGKGVSSWNSFYENTMAILRSWGLLILPQERGKANG